MRNIVLVVTYIITFIMIIAGIVLMQNEIFLAGVITFSVGFIYNFMFVVVQANDVPGRRHEAKEDE